MGSRNYHHLTQQVASRDMVLGRTLTPTAHQYTESLVLDIILGHFAWATFTGLTTAHLQFRELSYLGWFDRHASGHRLSTKLTHSTKAQFAYPLLAVLLFQKLHDGICIFLGVPHILTRSVAHFTTTPTTDRYRDTFASGLSPNRRSDILALPLSATLISPKRRMRIDAWRHEIALSAAECSCATRSLPSLAAQRGGDKGLGSVFRKRYPQNIAVDGCTRSIDGIYTYIGDNQPSHSISSGEMENMQARGHSFPVCHTCARLGAPAFMAENTGNKSSSLHLPGNDSLDEGCIKPRKDHNSRASALSMPRKFQRACFEQHRKALTYRTKADAHADHHVIGRFTHLTEHQLPSPFGPH
ncbi:hypothetical protein SODALDRAFT_377927 [Sodiomyces alkalinus F11]|uniref:Uncharacterized protein n=1 Tax=Sodiomyces alkalinus (strain CBS 110278 / VKM F-3762 / F11) TaxID=1314773 RepID=A0A3N2Q0B0_SODAK|nr:hypothetical protein SODALDRAFT_377927 [Sodiomyces alkalinus F11]ROT40045.1 hypothetical protein SODALDRAFT_377927 [Sodiomyces alkalinus F11]